MAKLLVLSVAKKKGFLNVRLINDGTVGAVVKRSTVALRVVGSIPARNKNLFKLTGSGSGSGCLRM